MSQSYGMINKEIFQQIAGGFAVVKGYDRWNIGKIVWEKGVEDTNIKKIQPSCEQDNKVEKGAATDRLLDEHVLIAEDGTNLHLRIVEKKRRKSYAVLEVQGKYQITQFKLTLYLIKSGKQNADRKVETVAFENHRSITDIGTIKFSNEEVNQYLAIVKDYNSFHRGENAIVPGLLILQRMLYDLVELFPQRQPKSVEVIYRAPLYVNEICQIVSVGNGAIYGEANQMILWEMRYQL